jgi:hypothetical protein
VRVNLQPASKAVSADPKVSPLPIGTSSFSQTFSAAEAVKGQQDSASHPGRGNEKKSDATKTSPTKPEAAPALSPAQPVTPQSATPQLAAPQPVAATQPFGTQTSGDDQHAGLQNVQPIAGTASGVTEQSQIAMGGVEVVPPTNTAAPTDTAVDGKDSASDDSTAGAIAEQTSASAPVVAAQQPVPFVPEQAPIAGVNAPDLTATAADGQSLTGMSSAKDEISKPAGASTKDSKAGSSDVRSKQKFTDSNTQNLVAPSSNPSSFKVAEAMAHADHGGGAMQPGVNDAAIQQAAQAAVSAATEGKQAVAHNGDNGAAAPQVASQAPSNTAATNSAVADAQSMPAVNNARLIQSMHQSEMRLGMYSAEFGSISINTSLTHQSIATQISMDHSALGHALSAHLSAIEEKLSNAYGLQARVEVRDGSASSGNSSAHSGEKQQGRANNSTMSSSPLPSAVHAMTQSTSALAADTSRLDIRI